MWWKEAVFYQIYIPGFMDTTGNGSGDLCGVISQLPYLADLGINAIWLTPFYQSPMIDNGYDISDYRKINGSLGTMEEFDRLIKVADKTGIRIIIDMVLNHTSTNHQWFRESRSSLVNSKRDWYIWRQAPPNNWESFFGGSAWKKDPVTDTYYYHAFDEKMADLNWENNNVREAMYQILQFWLKKGVAGFRLDVINFLKAGLSWNKDNPEKNTKQDHRLDMNSPGLPEVIGEIRKLVKEYGDIYLLGEVGSENPELLASYTGKDLLDGVFNFNLGSIKTLDYSIIRRELDGAAGLYTFPERETTLFFSSHDMARFSSRLCENNIHRIKGIGALLLTAPGIPFIFQGDETGLSDYSPQSPGDFHDPRAINNFRESIKKGETEESAFLKARKESRDNSRALYLSASRKSRYPQKPPVPSSEPFGERVRKEQEGMDGSILEWTRKLIKLRRENRVFRDGEFTSLDSSGHHFVFMRSLDGSRWITAINNKTRPVALNRSWETDLRIVSGHEEEIPETGEIRSIPGMTTIIFRVR